MSHRGIDLGSLRERTITPPRLRALKAAVRARVDARDRRGKVLRVGFAIVTAASLATVVGLRSRSPSAAPLDAAPHVTSTTTTPPPPSSGFVSADGSRIEYLAPLAEVVSDSPRALHLLRGAARFDVVHRSDAPFRVTAGPVVVEDVGTIFEVTLVSSKIVRVQVDAGAVLVTGVGPPRTLTAGDEATFDAEPPTRVLDPKPAIAPTPPPTMTWQRLASEGEDARAYAMLQRTPPRTPEDLLAAADVARASGHSEQAAEWLRAAVNGFPSDPRFEAAAFTLGKVLLEELGRPSAAADAFALASSRGGPLAEDALAREAEAWSAAGDRERARERSARYLDLYPSGRHRTTMRRLADAP